jgi:hypothetical protein
VRSWGRLPVRVKAATLMEREILDGDRPVSAADHGTINANGGNNSYIAGSFGIGRLDSFALRVSR